MKSWLDENYPILACLVIVLIGVVIIALTPPTVVVAATDPGNSCLLWKVAGTQLIYRCEDEDTGTVCYSQGIMLFCVGP